jgi:hypothetical protein
MEELPASMRGVAEQVAGKMGTESGPTTAGKIATDLRAAGDTETAARQAEINAAHQQELVAHQARTQQREADIAAREQQAESQTQQQFGGMQPQTAVETVRNRTLAHHNDAEDLKNQLYGEAGQSVGAIGDAAVKTAHFDVAKDLAEQGIKPSDYPKTYSTAGDMLDALQRWSADAKPKDLLSVENFRKELNQVAGGASNLSDKRAAGKIMDAFDDWQAKSMQSPRDYQGDPDALPKFLAARQANRNFRENFGYNADARDPGGQAINKLVTHDLTNDQVANMLIGSEVGSGNRAAVLRRLDEVSNGDPAIRDSLRGAMWNQLREGGPKAIQEFLRGSGREVANQHFSEVEQNLMRSHAETTAQSAIERNIAKQTAKDTMPKEPPSAEQGPMAALADRILGTGREKSEEGLFRSIIGMAKTGASEDNRTLAALMRGLSPEAQNNLGAQVVRNLGLNKSGDFSLTQFSNRWNNEFSDAAKALLIRDPAHREALDHIATIADRWEDIQKKFVNVSKTAPQAAFSAFMEKIFASALGVGATHFPKTVAAAVIPAAAGYGTAKFFASPASTSSFAKFARATASSNGTITPAMRITARNLANTVAPREQ